MEGIFLTSSLQNQSIVDEQSENKVVRCVMEIVELLKPLSGTDRAEAAHTIYEGIFKDWYPRIIANHSKEPICSRQCNACCYQYLATSQEEAMLVLKVARKRNLVPSLKALKYQSRFRTPEQYWSRYGKRTKCGFLDPKQGCTIYKYRPLACRALLSMDASPKLCEPDENGKPRQVKYLYNEPSEIVMSALLNLAVIDGTDPFVNYEELRKKALPITSLPQRLVRLIEKK